MAERSESPSTGPRGRRSTPGRGGPKGGGAGRSGPKGPRRGGAPGGDRRGGAPSSRGGRGPGGRDEAPRSEPAGPRTWGSLARKGAGRLGEDRRGAGTAAPSGRAPEAHEAEEWIDEGPVRREATKAVGRGVRGSQPDRSRRERRPLEDAEIDVTVAEASRAVGRDRAGRVEARLKEAAKAFDGERFAEARKILAPLVDQAPSSVALRELNGLTLYRLGRWKAAAEELEVFRELSGSTDQHPVLADCYRALRRWADVDDLWEELRAASPSAELVTEGRIVTAGALADRDRLPEAIELLDKGFRWPKRPLVHHLRRGYALADLYERAGDVPRARSLFARIAAADPDFGDVEARRDALG
ncbi:tetratricopeptide repeat protein [Actinomarinicola tropica]|uniref:Tetratricopeptide repeat protein n=1 Tax=Actinomarinicola tropica TaxID=2789776 RepID=A0A5Q2RPS5_9ACTN|nr:tetratricopeptide repeat protein [Actinomarinicola tropica]QGG95215.1 hypothetical protein GH723_08975 [Actinomarinicola tropica]